MIIEMKSTHLQWRKALQVLVIMRLMGIECLQTLNFQSANDILSGDYAKKRIYTIDEASKVSGMKNTFKIRYK